MKKTIEQKELASIQYVGIPGATSSCLNAIVRFVHFGDKINTAKLLSCRGQHSGAHCFILDINCGDLVAIRSGFSSGYLGEGSGGLSDALQLLYRHGADIDEYDVSEGLMERLDRACLLNDDLEGLDEKSIVRPERWYDYLRPNKFGKFHDDSLLNRLFPAAIPYELIDLRIVDLALRFSDDPDGAINAGYRRLEDTVRKSTGLEVESGSRLFSKAFQANNSILYWEDKNDSEHAGKASLFTSVFGAYRNRRAHRELNTGECEMLREFLLLNELFLLEHSAKPRPENHEK